MARITECSCLCAMAIGLAGAVGCMGENELDGVNDEVVEDQAYEIGQNVGQSSQNEASGEYETAADYGKRIAWRNSDGRWEEFWVGSDGAVWHRWESFPGSGYNSGNHSLGGHVTSGIGVDNNADGRLEIFVRADGGDLNHKWQLTPGGAWSNWASLGGQLKAFTGVYANLRNGRLEVTVTGVDNLPHIKRQLQPNCCWDPVWR